MRRKRRRKSTSKNTTCRTTHRKRTPRKRLRRGVIHTEETKRKLASSTVQNIASGKIKATSKLERTVRAQLHALGVKHVYQYPLLDPETGLYVAALDFYLPDLKIALEVNGTYWHADPRFYDPDHLNAAQASTVKRYELKRAHLKRLDIELCEVWEADVKENPMRAVKEALGM